MKWLSTLTLSFICSRALHSQHFVYNEFNQLVSFAYQIGDTRSYFYDKLGNPISETKTGGQITLSQRVLLQGPYVSSAGMMMDSLRHLKKALYWKNAAIEKERIRTKMNEL